jgi:hypothetical protein
MFKVYAYQELIDMLLLDGQVGRAR